MATLVEAPQSTPFAVIRDWLSVASVTVSSFIARVTTPPAVLHVKAFESQR
jgi:hypothetical protein